MLYLPLIWTVGESWSCLILALEVCHEAAPRLESQASSCGQTGKVGLFLFCLYWREFLKARECYKAFLTMHRNFICVVIQELRNVKNTMEFLRTVNFSCEMSRKISLTKITVRAVEFACRLTPVDYPEVGLRLISLPRETN